MADVKELIHITVEWIKKYKIIMSSMFISAIVILCAIQLFVSSKEAKKFEIAGRQIVEMSQNIIKHYQTSPSYWGLSSNEVIGKKLYPNNIDIRNGKLIGYFSNIIEVGADDNGNMVMPTAKNFVIAYNGLNKKQCIGLGSHKFNKKFWLKVSKITIKNNKTTTDFSWGDKKYKLPITRRKLEVLCQKDNNGVIIHF